MTTFYAAVKWEHGKRPALHDVELSLIILVDTLVHEHGYTPDEVVRVFERAIDELAELET